MIKVLSGLVAAIVIAAASFFGFEFYVQHRIAGEIETAFEQIRATGGKASHGKLSFDLLNGTLTVADIAGQSAAQPPVVSVKIASLTASGVRQPDAARFSAETIEIGDLEISGSIATQPPSGLTYKAPRITVKDFSGTAGLQQPPASSSLVDIYRSALAQFAGVTATSITAPSLAATMNQGATTPGGGEFAYSGLAILGIKDGRIANTKMERVVFTVNTQPPTGKPDKLTGDVTDIAGHDIDTTAMAAIFDPQKANDDQYYRAYRQITMGPYVVTSGQGVNMRIEGMTIDDLALRPSRMQLPDLLALIPPPNAPPPTAAQMRALIDKVANVYEGIRIGNAEMRGFAVETPGGPVKLSAMRFNLDKGKINEFAIEGVDGRTPQGPVKVGRFALKSLDVANLLRLSAQFAGSLQPPPPDKALEMIPLIGGVELKELVVPFKNTGKPVSIENFSLDWGQFVGPIPTKVRLIAKLTSPVDKTNPAMTPLVAAGIDTGTIDLDLGAAWTEASRTFALEPASFEFGSVLRVSARASLANVPRAIFSPNAAQALAMAPQIEAGTLELSLRDIGGVDLTIAEYARMKSINRGSARGPFVDEFEAFGKQVAADNPEAVAAVGALSRFFETPGQTFNIKLTPRGKVTGAQLMQLLNTDPLAALAQFRIEASTGL